MMNNPNAIANLKPFKKGQSGNPAGKPKGTKSLITILRDIMNADKGTLNGTTVDGNTLLMATLYKKALKGEDLSAIREILDRIEGKPIQINENINTNTEITFTIDEG